MVVGCLGDITFQVSSETVETLDNMKWSGSANYATHLRHNTHALTEFTGLNPDEITFEMVLSDYLGIEPLDELTKIWKYEREGTSVPMTLGNHAYGKYRWVITGHDTDIVHYDKDGKMTYATVTVNLLEYLRE